MVCILHSMLINSSTASISLAWAAEHRGLVFPTSSPAFESQNGRKANKSALLWTLHYKPLKASAPTTSSGRPSSPHRSLQERTHEATDQADTAGAHPSQKAQMHYECITNRTDQSPYTTRPSPLARYHTLQRLTLHHPRQPILFFLIPTNTQDTDMWYLVIEPTL